MKSLIRVALEHHYGWQVYAVMATSLAEAAYLAVRQSHEFLTDANHRHEEGSQTMKWGGKTLSWNSVRVFKNGRSPRFAMAPDWVQDGPGAYWLAVNYRAALSGEVNPRWMTIGDHSRRAAIGLVAA